MNEVTTKLTLTYHNIDNRDQTPVLVSYLRNFLALPHYNNPFRQSRGSHHFEIWYLLGSSIRGKIF